MKKQYILTLLLTLMFVGLSFGGAMAQTGGSISGDDVCGKWDPVAKKIINPCTVNSVAAIAKGVLTVIVSLGLPLLIIFVAYRFVVAWFALRAGNASAYKEALQKAGNAILGFMFIVALFGGLFVVILNYFGVKSDSNFDPMQILRLFSEAFIPHAYAQTPNQYLPNPTGVNNLYDFILSVLRLVMRFFIYPALIVIWVWTGFAFVAAQGNPDALKKAKQWFVYAFVSTLVIFVLQAFLIALRGTVQEILPGTRQTQNNAPSPSPAPAGAGTVDGRTPPAAGQPGASCNGGAGVIGVDGTCRGGAGAGSTNSSEFCREKAVGTLCTVPFSSGYQTGTCSFNGDGVKGCYVAQLGDRCVSVNDTVGAIDAAGQCQIGGRPLVDIGGSCRISAECRSGLSCTSGTCQQQ